MYCLYCKTTLIPIDEEGSKKECRKCRPISLKSHKSRILQKFCLSPFLFRKLKNVETAVQSSKEPYVRHFAKNLSVSVSVWKVKRKNVELPFNQPTEQ